MNVKVRCSRFATSEHKSFAVVLLAGTAIALSMAGSAHAQTTQTEQAPGVEEIVVTGTRVVRDGYQAPTPLTVVGVEQFQSQATANIADYLNTLPSFAGGDSPANSSGTISAGTAGINSLDLRNLGTSRTLVLLDGQRSVGVNLTGIVDVNLIPQSLVSRVDVVTGGASAAYGSDALSGVVNFVLDKKFTGVKGEVSGGVTTYGDDRNWDLALTGGTGFANDRGHFLISGEASFNAGVLAADRPWNKQGNQFMSNPNYTPTNGQPAVLLLSQVGLSNTVVGGIITDGPLRGVAFGPGGTPYQFAYGDLVSDPDMHGGAWQSSQIRATLGSGLDSRQVRQSAFTRLSYDITDNVEVFGQLTWSHHNNLAQCCPIEDTATEVLTPDNAFLPPSVAARMLALGVQSITVGTVNQDLPPIFTVNDITTNRNVLGASGYFDAIDTKWTWNAYFQNGVTRTAESAHNVTSYTLKGMAEDAVRAPNGTIVCRSTLTDPKNGCVPYNILGIGVNSQAAINYITGSGDYPLRHERFTQNVWAAAVNGEPFSDWAGPVSLAFGIEHRTESVKASSGARELDYDWWAGNFQPTNGSYNVTEGFAETVIPLAKDAAWAKALDVNAAIRATSYSLSGFVTTWKVGSTYSPIDDVRFRVTRSRDIRAANLSELFSGGGGSASAGLNPFRNNETDQFTVSTVGNLNLRPEKSDTTGLGVVLQPSFVPGLSASVDYWNLDISEAIGTLDAQKIINYCFTGNKDLCSAITFGPGQVITLVKNSPFNLVTQIARGIDFEAGYRTPLDALISDAGGDIALRVLATRNLKNFTSNGINIPTDTVGQNSVGGTPTWRWTASATYSNDPVTVDFTGRGVSAGVVDNTFIQCTSACPASTVTHQTVSNNHVDGAVYFDTSITYKIGHRSEIGSDIDLFLNVRNLFNKDPAVVSDGPGGFSFDHAQVNANFYDTLGRVFRAGLRFKM